MNDKFTKDFVAAFIIGSTVAAACLAVGFGLGYFLTMLPAPLFVVFVVFLFVGYNLRMAWQWAKEKKEDDNEL
ncbi:hypothetical protein A2108_00890 [Candidatus Wolfebacteria bacterium GWA1_42_9]|uniref:Uncharacterized protein n=1 Tax=Candidatus Wolfebacteria bacterium GWA1_42_9 TaxID=1802553 RepID=A0A1F8DNS6_9BACT|nr:MAG: hypothetical protein A2108_00890 [Candidatus Wolfebacteria bacterium GWA1_42_9]